MPPPSTQGDLFSSGAAQPGASAVVSNPADDVPAGPGTPSLMLVDASGFIFRAFHALPPMTTSKGVPTNAVLGFARMMLKLLRERKPTHVALCFDRDSRLGRLEIDPSYKANRSETPPDLVKQFELIRRMAGALSLPILEMKGWEADDVIATMTDRARRDGFEVEIISSDKDLLQLLAEGVHLYDPAKDQEIGEAEAQLKFGVPPSRLRDYLALVGDAVDNVPKVPGIGPKTAAELLTQFGDLKTLLARVDEVQKPRIREAIKSHREQIDRALQLVSFRHDLPVDAKPADLVRREIHQAEARVLFSELEFHRLLGELPQAAPTASLRTALLVQDIAGLEAVGRALAHAPTIALVPDFEGEPHSATLTGLALISGAAGPWYLDAAACGARALSRVLAPVLNRPEVKLAAPDAKALMHLLGSVGLEVGAPDTDVELFSFLLSSANRDHSLATQARARLQLELPPWPPPGRAQPGPEQRSAYFGAAVEAAERLAQLLNTELEGRGLTRVAREIDLALVPVLAKMERTGVAVSLSALEETSVQVDALCGTMLAEVYRLAGREFNVGSPPQLAQVLFTDLKLPVIRKGKTGPSTDHEVLEKLAEQHPLPRAIIEYRNVAKLKSTYLDTLPALVGADGRIRTTFHQTAAATGRLSSTNPNLQNIPIRTELGRQIRRAFVAEPGWVLVSADYSQVELRILAHIAKDEGLVRAFAENADVHARCAAEVFGVPEAEVSPEMRRVAKMVNYGIAYGLSAHGLASRLTIPVEEAKSIIDRYFARFTGIARYIESTIAEGRKTGGVASLFGRRRDLPDLNSRNRSLAQAAERAAINMPIQGTAADLIKLAMLDLDRRIPAAKLNGRMVLQVHDELLFESPKEEAEQLARLAREAMEGVAKLDVPLLVDVGTGPSWADAH